MTGTRVVRTIQPAAMFRASFDETPAVVEKIPVAAYARVSTEKEEQESSFERQVEHYTSLIMSNSEWKFVKVYADPGISGTKADKRPEFMQMIQDARDGKIKRILVKSISRFARNTVDALTYIRELRDLGVAVKFESENIDTMTPGGEVLLTILASIAEQESRSISKNIKWGWQKRFQEGDVFINTGNMLGYRRVGTDENGHKTYEIVEEEAQMIRQIFREYISGIPVSHIRRHLEEAGYKTKRGKDKWTDAGVTGILKNYKYTGNAIMGQTYKADVLSKRVKNTGQAPMYEIKNSHPAIVDEETFQQAQAERLRRQREKDSASGGSRYTSKYAFSGLIVCGNCGSKYRRHVRTIFGTGEEVAFWGCSRKIEHGNKCCDTKHIRESIIQKTYLKLVLELIDSAEEIIDEIEEATNKNELGKAEINVIDRTTELQNEIMQAYNDRNSGKITDDQYKRIVINNQAEMQKLQARREEIQVESAKANTAKQWLKILKVQGTAERDMTTEELDIMRTMVERIICYENEMEVQFKCGVTKRAAYII